jgi:hypothetical protein
MGIFYWFLAVGMLIDHWWPIVFGSKKPGTSDFLFPGLYLLTAAVSQVIAHRTFVRISENSIEVRHLFGTKVLPFANIKGRRTYTEKADPYGTPARHLVLEPKDGSFPRLDIKESKEFDETFYRWFDSLPDLDKLDGIEEPKSKYANFSLV